MNELTRQRIILFGFLLLFGNQFVVVYTFVMAYLHNGATLVHVNLFGEQYLDAIVLGITVLISGCAFYLLYQQHAQVLNKINSKS
jgi:hypothetical protein